MSVPNASQIEIATGPLNGEQLWGELGTVLNELGSLGVNEVIVEFGWGCVMPMENLWQPKAVRIGEIEALLLSMVTSGLLQLGSGDVSVRHDNIDVLFSHHSRIIIKTLNRALADRIVQHWIQNRFVVFARTGGSEWQQHGNDSPGVSAP